MSIISEVFKYGGSQNTHDISRIKAIYLTTTEVVEKAISFVATQMIYSYSTTCTTYFLAGDGRAGWH